MAHKLFLFNFFILPFFFVTCNSLEPPPPEKTITLTLEDVSCIEAWINLNTSNLQLPTTIILEQNNETKKTINLDKADTLLYIDSLLPNTTHTFQASSIQHQVSSNKLSVTTLDTTSHNFTWQTFTFGEHSSSNLRDVAIIDENNIWAVGQIYLNDSLGQPDTQPYGAIHWNGIEWTPIKVPYHDFGSTNTFPGPLKTILSFGPDSIYVTSSANLLKFEGDEWVEKAFFMRSVPFDGQVLKMWGSNGNDIYCAGRTGAIYKFTGTNWNKLYSGTELDIYDIWGDYNERIDEWEILAVASDYYHSSDRKIIKIASNQSEIISDEPLYQPLRALWFSTNKQYYVTGSGIYQKHHLSDELWNNKPQDITTYSTYAIRGSNINNVIGVGAFGDVIHFNGINWKNNYQEPLLSYGAYYAVAVENNIIIAVGTEQSKAVIIIGEK